MDHELKEILIDLLQSMKLRTAAVFDLGADVEGLKKALPQASQGTFAEKSGIARATSRIAFEGEIRLLDEAIERLRRMP